MKTKGQTHQFRLFGARKPVQHASVHQKNLDQSAPVPLETSFFFSSTSSTLALFMMGKFIQRPGLQPVCCV